MNTTFIWLFTGDIELLHNYLNPHLELRFEALPRPE